MLTVGGGGYYINRVWYDCDATCGIIQTQAVCGVRFFVIPFCIRGNKRGKMAVLLFGERVVAGDIFYNGESTAFCGAALRGRHFRRDNFPETEASRRNGILSFVDLVCFRGARSLGGCLM